MKSLTTISGKPASVAVALPESGPDRSGNIITRIKNSFSSFSLSPLKVSLRQSPAAQRNLALFALMLAVVIFPHIAGAEDLLKSQKADANDTFGHGSTVEWVLYIAEIIVSVVGYIKTRNPMVFAGLVILILITRAFFSLAGS
ncbi:type IV conjugative transfer system pilin TraA [Erwinia billingiae]|uniref:type IV conjugative transfer system pilin TraA n=1 Tax=Erwinia billingiae TaxID=182337 RepID=UPI002245FC2B|nr:type IV conjugative transfer system pilin TraA [Erwinia billingiae]MCX0502145.1 conjugal transfer protein [Erwinia billingiae]